MADTNELKVEKLTSGNGPLPQPGDTVVVHYTGRFKDNWKFDSSHDRNEPFAFVLGTGQVIAGWDMVVANMQVGEKIKAIIPPQLAYGVSGYPNVIPPNATLIFEIELLGIRPTPV